MFLIIPGLIRDCILGMKFKKNAGVIVNIPENKLQLLTSNPHENHETIANIPLMALQQQEGSIEDKINNKIEEIDGINKDQLLQLQHILHEYKEVFDERPGLINGYEHSFRVTDNTPYILKGWAVPITYQQSVKGEIKRMLKFCIIERANSPYINLLVTVIKRDGKIRLCLDARKINSVTIPDYEGPPPINEILAKCSKVGIMSTIDLTNSIHK